MPKKSTTAPKSRFHPYHAPIIPTSDSELPSRMSTPMPGGKNPSFSSATDRLAQTGITSTTLYCELTRLRSIPTFRKRPLVVLHEDTTTILMVLVFPQGSITSLSMNLALNNPVPTLSSVPRSLRDCIALLNKSSEHLHCLGHLNLPPKPSDKTLTHTATQSPELSHRPKKMLRPHLANLLNPLNQTPRYEPPLLTLLPTLLSIAPDAHLVQQQVLCHRLDHKDRVMKVREETLHSHQASRLCSTHTSIPYM